MRKYVGKVTNITIDGKKVHGVDNFKKKELTYREALELMDETGVADVTVRYMFSLGVAVAEIDNFDFASVEDGTFLAYKSGGGKIEATGVYMLKYGDEDYSGKGGAVIRDVEFVAESLGDK